MEKKSSYTVIVDGQVFELEAAAVSALDFLQTDENTFHILKNGQSYSAQLIHADYNKKQLTLSINGNKYDLKLEDEYDLLVKKMGLAAGGSQKMKNVKAPMPGLILDILIEPGQVIAKGEKLLILEAMKMENILKAEGDGIVKSVKIDKGAAVDKGQVLIEME